MGFRVWGFAKPPWSRRFPEDPLRSIIGSCFRVWGFARPHRAGDLRNRVLFVSTASCVWGTKPQGSGLLLPPTPKPETLEPKPETLNPKPEDPNPKP